MSISFHAPDLVEGVRECDQIAPRPESTNVSGVAEHAEHVGGIGSLVAAEYTPRAIGSAKRLLRLLATGAVVPLSPHLGT